MRLRPLTLNFWLVALMPALFVMTIFIFSRDLNAQQITFTIEQCLGALQRLYTVATESCINKPVGFICNAGGAPVTEPAGPVSNALLSTGALVDVGVVDALHTLPIQVENDTAGILYLRMPAPQQYTALLLGDVNIRDLSLGDQSAWTQWTVQTSETPASCVAAPLSAVILQSTTSTVQLNINGATIQLNGTVVLRTRANQTLLTALSGYSTVSAHGQEQPLRSGELVLLTHADGDYTAPIYPPTLPAMFDTAALEDLPNALFDRPITLPQPGYLTTLGDTNLRVSPATNAQIITVIPMTEILGILGQSTNGEWYHVRRSTYETGWVAVSQVNPSSPLPVGQYNATPLPPQRYGNHGSLGRVLAPMGVNLLAGPDAQFATIAHLNLGTNLTLVSRSPYSPWLRVDFNGTGGWLPLLSIDTQASISALPIDTNAPPLPATPRPATPEGTWGNAFPDPATFAWDDIR